MDADEQVCRTQLIVNGDIGGTNARLQMYVWTLFRTILLCAALPVPFACCQFVTATSSTTPPALCSFFCRRRRWEVAPHAEPVLVHDARYQRCASSSVYTRCSTESRLVGSGCVLRVACCVLRVACCDPSTNFSVTGTAALFPLCAVK